MADFCILSQDIGIELSCFSPSSSEWGCGWFIALSHGHFWVRVSLGVAHFTTSDSVSTGCPCLLCGKLFILGQPSSFSGCGLRNADLWHVVTPLIVSLSDGIGRGRFWAKDWERKRVSPPHAGWAVPVGRGGSQALLSSGSPLVEHLLCTSRDGINTHWGPAV